MTVSLEWSETDGEGGDSTMKQPALELAAVVMGLGVAPWGPGLLLSWLGAPGESVIGAAVWGVCWYAWLAYQIVKRVRDAEHNE